jgi:hypothetical protein
MRKLVAGSKQTSPSEAAIMESLPGPCVTAWARMDVAGRMQPATKKRPKASALGCYPRGGIIRGEEQGGR